MTKMTMVVLIAVSLVGCKKKKAEEAAATASGSAAMGSAMGSATEQAAGSAAAGSAAAGSATTGSATMTGSAAAAGDSAKELALDAPMDAGNGVMLTFSKKETAKGGDNQPPTYQHKVVAKCGGKDVVVIDRTDEGGDGKVSVEQQPGKAIVTMNVHIAREGEIADEKEAAQLDLTTCAVAKQ